jgi:hypothetical protein
MKSWRLVIGIVLLVGCNPKTETNEASAIQLQPKLMVGSGTRMQISETEVAAVFGTDICDGNSNFLFNDSGSPNSSGCTNLTGKDQVTVTLLTKNVVFKERWKVTRGDGSNRTIINLNRPNGWLIYQATKVHN